MDEVAARASSTDCRWAIAAVVSWIRRSASTIAVTSSSLSAAASSPAPASSPAAVGPVMIGIAAVTRSTSACRASASSSSL